MPSSRIRQRLAQQVTVACEHAGEEVRVEAVEGFVGLHIDNVGTSLAVTFALDPDDARAVAASLVEMADVAERLLQEGRAAR